MVGKRGFVCVYLGLNWGDCNALGGEEKEFRDKKNRKNEEGKRGQERKRERERVNKD